MDKATGLLEKSIQILNLVMPIHALIDTFENLLKLTGDEKKVLEEVFEPRSFKRNQFILQKGDICTRHTFIVEGCFRMYSVDTQGKEHNLLFASEKDWVGDLESFYKQQPSDHYIESMERSVVLQVSRQALTRLFVKYPKFNRIFRVITENELVAAQKRILNNISLTAEDRYQHFLRLHPEYFNRISNVQIASFLGITPEFLSIIRRRLAQS